MTRTVSEALAQLPTTAHRNNLPTALRGRRDGFLIVLFGVLGFTREEVRKVTTADIRLDPVTIQGRTVPRDNGTPPGCPACAVTRWLRVALPAELGRKRDVAEAVDPRTFDPDVHDCDEGLEHEWRKATNIVPAIDQHGWLDVHQPISTRSLTTIAGRVQRFTGRREQRWEAPAAVPTRFDGMSRQQFTDEMDEFDLKVAQALARTAAALEEAQHTSDEMLGLLNTKTG
ncbi:hypothetical protein [Curtobacterium sp. MCBD17_040]|uniref:hypothetical protein n=1 Tax=Curtobacterium sp. MCBD17_040 TaxID=2175674 RepID=UPI0011B69BC5|nr:hypothetical protein [Curtobacterium sp. MCBD17_040]WIB65607.1 hypothetical protein DEI94_15930 [Curtobacterium sp. MCBD17_040]